MLPPNVTLVTESPSFRYVIVIDQDQRNQLIAIWRQFLENCSVVRSIRTPILDMSADEGRATLKKESKNRML